MQRQFASLCLLLASLPLYAHHSFAVHFVSNVTLEVTGVVKEFRFSNPHGILTFTATDASGQAVEWRGETNSSNVLRLRGWDKDSLQADETITVLGFPARDGTNYLRISRIIFADGRVLAGQGVAVPAGDND